MDGRATFAAESIMGVVKQFSNTIYKVIFCTWIVVSGCLVMISEIYLLSLISYIKFNILLEKFNE